MSRHTACMHLPHSPRHLSSWKAPSHSPRSERPAVQSPSSPSQPSSLFSSSPSFKHRMAPPRKRRFSFHEELASPSHHGTVLPSSTPPLSQLLPLAHSKADLATVHASPQLKAAPLLLFLAVSHFLFSLKAQLSSSPALSTLLPTKKKCLRRPIRLFIQHRLQALRALLFVSRSVNRILTMNYDSPRRKKKNLTSQTLSTSTR